MAKTDDPITSAPESSASTRNDGNDAGGFECNICFDLAKDPVITLCGHLYCWPCLYRWLQGHSQAHECPVCKALVVEDKVIPLYGRGKTPIDPRSKPIPGVEIPHRPTGQRTQTVPSTEYNNFANIVLGFMGFMPLASASFNNFGMYAGLGGVFSPFLGFQFNGSSWYHNEYTGGPSRENGESSRGVQTDDEKLRKILLIILLFVLFAFLSL